MLRSIPTDGRSDSDSLDADMPRIHRRLSPNLAALQPIFMFIGVGCIIAGGVLMSMAVSSHWYLLRALGVVLPINMSGTRIPSVSVTAASLLDNTSIIS